MNNTNLYFTSNDIDLLDSNIDKIKEEADLIRDKMFQPPIDIKKKYLDCILNFTKSKNRKLYGGYALNELILLEKNIKPIYEEGTVHDVDFYSPDPVNDVIDLCDKLHKLGLGEVRCGEAMHNETYTIKIDGEVYCDISYVPKGIYNRMPYTTSKSGLILIHPHWMWIDYLRQIVDPINSWFRIEKCYKRFHVLQQIYKFPVNLNGIDTGKSTLDLDHALHTILRFLKDRQSTITVGLYAYNYYLDKSGSTKKMSRGSKGGNTRHRTSDASLKYLDVPYYEFISTDYKKDVLDLLDELKRAFPGDDGSITYTEYYPFFQFTGYNINIYYKEVMIAKIYSNNKKCIPYQDLPCMHYSKNPTDIKKMDGFIRLGTFSLTLMYSLINIQRYRVNKDTDAKDLFYTITSHLLHMRNFFLDKSGKTILDETPFKELIVNCVGHTLTAKMEKDLRIKENKKENKRYTFTYDPSHAITKRPVLFFANSSGNSIQNCKNFKIAPCENPPAGNDPDIDVDIDETDKTTDQATK